MMEEHEWMDKGDLVRAVRVAKIKDLNKAAKELGGHYDLKRILGRPVETIFDYFKCAGTLFEENASAEDVKAELARGIEAGDAWYVGLALTVVELNPRLLHKLLENKMP